MIHLVNMSKSYRVEHGTKIVIRPTNLTLPVNKQHIAVLGVSGSGKSVFIRLIAGAEDPTTGRVIRKCTISWPFGSAPGITHNLSGAENVRFITRLYGADFESALASVDAITELGSALYEPVLTYTAAMRGKLVYSLSLAIDFDCYLLDEVMYAGVIGEPAFQQRAKEVLEKKLRRSGMLFVSQHESKVKEHCETALVLHNGHLFPFESLDEATEFYRLVKPQ
jgi:capsular polysaccharide transport system ATP-binding protein